MSSGICKDIKKLNPLCQILLEKAIEELKKNNVKPLIVETYRAQSRQDYLYAQGRTRPGKKVTWTKNSIHTKKNAVDIIPQEEKNGRLSAVWDTKNKKYDKIIYTMGKYGFEAGANWAKNKDYPHYQIAGVSTNGTYYNKNNTNKYITQMIQKMLNIKLGIHLVADGVWGALTDAAIKEYKKSKKYKIINSNVGKKTLKGLLS